MRVRSSTMRWQGGVVGLIGAIAALLSWQLGCDLSSDTLGIGLFPFLAGMGLLVCGLWLAFHCGEEQGPQWPTGGNLLRVLALPVSLALYTVATQVLGYFLATAAFVFSQTWLLGARVWWKSLLVSAGAALAFHFVFRVWLQLPLPRGIILG